MSTPIRRILMASMVGSTIEFFDFYTYANAAVLVFPKQFFPASDPAAAVMQSLATFALAFFARPIGSAFFGHFGDRIGRKATLVAALLTMGISTILIGMLPTYASIGALAPALLALCRFGQGLGLGGEWGGAILLATENAPAGKRAWFGMFPQLGAPIGFLLSGGIFLALRLALTTEEFLDYGWRIPFLASALLVAVGLYVRLRIEETPAFRAALQSNLRVRVPIVHVLREHGLSLLIGTLLAVATFQLFYLLTVFSQNWMTTTYHMPAAQALQIQLFSVLFFALAIPLSGLLADRKGAHKTMIAVTSAIALYGLFYGEMFGDPDPVLIAAFLSLGMLLMGTTYGPLGAVLGALFPTQLRYTGLSLTFNLAGILGASLAPYIATSLARNYGIQTVGYYLCVGAVLSLVAMLASTRVHRAAPAPAQGTDAA